MNIENKSNVQRKVDETYPNKITREGFYGNGALMTFLFPISPESREILTKYILKSSLCLPGKLTDKQNEQN